jgi:FkbM family methyltransferase
MKSRVVISLLAFIAPVTKGAKVAISADAVVRKIGGKTNKRWGKREELPTFGLPGTRSVPVVPNVGTKDSFLTFKDKIQRDNSEESSQPDSSWVYDNIFRHTMNTVKKQEDYIFVEFGAKDGRMLSNTLLFEKAFGWQGLLVEALPHYVRDLRRNRDCILSSNPTIGSCIAVGLDTIANKELYFSSRGDPDQAKNGKEVDKDDPSTIVVKTETLQNLFDKFNVPHVDFLSADCQGCELNALQGINFEKTKVDVVDYEVGSPDFCNVKAMFDKLGYTTIFLNIGPDAIFLSPEIVKAIPIAPEPQPILPGLDTKINLPHFMEMKKNHSQACQDNIWEFGAPWPPNFASS